MARLTQKQVEHIARLARLYLTKEEKEKFAEELSVILDWVRELQELDTSKVEPTTNITGLVNVMAEDQINPSPISRSDLLSNAPVQEEGSIKVKAIL
jgi:aspartyl-tRNA(Asn)/glutamyl-tRNA(Gln) amidotransferase subunit C